MKFRYYYLFAFFTLLFLFYPGDSLYIKLFSYNRNLFIKASSYTPPKKYEIPTAKQAPPPAVTADAAYIIDLQSFSPIYGKNEKKQLFPASTTKIVTALVAMDVYKPDDVVTIKRVISEGQVMGLVVGEKISIENLLYGMLVHSGNDAAYAVADAYGYDKFIALMNQKAKNIGMQSSHFMNPAGLDEPNQLSSAFDLALASRELLSNKLLRKIVGTKEITISDEDFKLFHRLTNVNRLLGEIEGIGGLKTGYTESAGENLISFYKHNDHNLLIVVLKSQDRFADTKTIVKWIDDNVTYIPL